MSTDYFFEGAEKLLEIWFCSADKNCTDDLRSIPRSYIEDLLKIVKCEIIGEKQTTDMTAYLLSESSLFVSKNRFILKTCGKTTLLEAVKPLMQLVKLHCKNFVVEDFFYSRKKFERPDLQNELYQRFDEEVKFLDTIFQNGAAYILGRLNDDCWYLYTKDSGGVTKADQTLELLMQDLDSDVMSMFYKNNDTDVKQSREKCGVDQLFPGAIIDDALFDPCGYSANGVMKNGEYFTIHVTPEEKFSYVSFETNAAEACYHRLITQVLEMFKPGKFIMTLFANQASRKRNLHQELQNLHIFGGYRRKDHQLSQFQNYTLTYTHYQKDSSINGQAETLRYHKHSERS